MKKIKVERLVRPLEWVRKTKIDELKVANVSFEKEHGVRNVISKYNTRYGRRTGRFVHVAYNQEAERMGIYVVSQEERKNELNGDKFLLCPVSHRFNIRDSRYLVGIGIYFGKPKKKETFIYNSS